MIVFLDTVSSYSYFTFCINKNIDKNKTKNIINQVYYY